MPERLTECLVRRGHLTAEAAEEALERQVLMGGALDTALFELALVEEDAVREAMSEAFGLEVATRADVTRAVDPRALRALPERWAIKHRLAPVALETGGETLSVLSPAPADVQRIVRLGELLEVTLRPLLAPEFRVEERLSLLYGVKPAERHRALIAGFGGRTATMEGSVGPSGEDLDLASALARLQSAESRDHIGRTALRYIGRGFEVSALFIVGQGMLEGWMARGQNTDHLPAATLPLDPDSAFRVVLDTGAHYLGPLSEEAAHVGFVEAIGRPAPRNVLIVPIRIKERSVALLYAENGRHEISPQLAQRVLTFLPYVQSAMLTLLMRRKAASFSQLPRSESVESMLPLEILPVPIPADYASEPPSATPLPEVEIDITEEEDTAALPENEAADTIALPEIEEADTTALPEVAEADTTALPENEAADTTALPEIEADADDLDGGTDDSPAAPAPEGSVDHDVETPPESTPSEIDAAFEATLADLERSADGPDEHGHWSHLPNLDGAATVEVSIEPLAPLLGSSAADTVEIGAPPEHELRTSVPEPSTVADGAPQPLASLQLERRVVEISEPGTSDLWEPVRIDFEPPVESGDLPVEPSGSSEVTPEESLETPFGVNVPSEAPAVLEPPRLPTEELLPLPDEFSIDLPTGEAGIPAPEEVRDESPAETPSSDLPSEEPPLPPSLDLPSEEEPPPPPSAEASSIDLPSQEEDPPPPPEAHSIDLPSEEVPPPPPEAPSVELPFEEEPPPPPPDEASSIDLSSEEEPSPPPEAPSVDLPSEEEPPPPPEARSVDLPSEEVPPPPRLDPVEQDVVSLDLPAREGLSVDLAEDSPAASADGISVDLEGMGTPFELEPNAVTEVPPSAFEPEAPPSLQGIPVVMGKPEADEPAPEVKAAELPDEDEPVDAGPTPAIAVEAPAGGWGIVDELGSQDLTPVPNGLQSAAGLAEPDGRDALTQTSFSVLSGEGVPRDEWEASGEDWDDVDVEDAPSLEVERRPIIRHERSTPPATVAANQESPVFARPVEEPAAAVGPEITKAIGPDVKARLEQLQHPMKAIRDLARSALSAMGPAVLPHLQYDFPGPLLVDPFAPEVVLPAFADCGPVLHLFTEFGREAHPLVSTQLEAPDPMVRFFATYFYSAVYVPEVVPRLVQRLHDEEARICMAAARTLFGYRSHPQFGLVTEHLHGRLEASSVAARRHSAFLLGLFRDVSAIPRLIGVLERKERALADVAENALAEITKQDFGTSARRWRSWWNKNGSRNRMEWLIEGLGSKNDAIRRSAFDELVAVTNLDFDYDPTGPRRPREQARKRWLKWWKDEGQLLDEA